MKGYHPSKGKIYGSTLLKFHFILGSGLYLGVRFEIWIFCFDLVAVIKIRNPGAELQGLVYWQNYQLYE